MSSVKNIAIFASGSGSNAQKIFEYFRESSMNVKVALVLSNNPNAYVLERADNFEIPSHVFSKADFYESPKIIDLLKKLEIDLIVLAGFLWLIPENFIKEYPKKIINIHPALLPKFGGKGMYGDRVHQAVFDAKEKESGITIHYVNERFDEGEIIRKYSFTISTQDDVNSIRLGVQKLEHLYFAPVIADVLKLQ